MTDTDTYPGVETDEDEKKKDKYPGATGPISPAMATGGPTGTVPLPMPNAVGAPAAMQAPDMSGAIPPTSPMPAPNLGPQPNRQQAIENTIGVAPNPTDKQYQPASPSIRQRIGAGLVAFKNPELGNKMIEEDVQRPVQQYGREAGAYGQKLGALEKGEQAQSEGELRSAQARAYDQRGLTPIEVANINAQSRQGIADTNVTGRKDVANIQQAGAGERTVATVTGAGERNTATIAGENQRTAETNKSHEKVAEDKGTDAGTWSIQEDAQGNPIEFNSKTGATRPAPNIQKSGTKSKGDAAKEKLTEPVDTAIGYADDYLNNNAFTGAGDEALQEKFFELAKPATGFRMTQPQMDMLRNSRGWMGGAEAHLRHMATGTWFSNEQRQQIVNTMKELGEAKKKAISGENESEPERPKGVPAEAKWNKEARKWQLTKAQ